MPSSRPAVHRWYPAALSIATLVAAFGFMSAMTRQAVQRLDRLEIVRDGQVVAELNSDMNGGVLRLFNTRGNETLAIRIGDDGGADIRLNDRAGARALSVTTGDQILRVTANSLDRDRLVFESGAEIVPMDGDADPVMALGLQLSDFTQDLRDLQHEHDQLERQMRDLRPGQSTSSIVDRVQRSIDELRRLQTDVQREVRRLNDDSNRRRSDLSDLSRRIQRLESRRP